MKRSKLFITAILIVTLSLLSYGAIKSENGRVTPASTETVLEDEMVIENWMTTPFVDFTEEPLEFEDWMTEPFVIN